jgi:hypothetical protein
MNPPDRDSVSPAWLEIVRQQVGSMRFGVVQIVVHEGQVVQIERTEKVRLPAKSAKTSDAPASAIARD